MPAYLQSLPSSAIRFHTIFTPSNHNHRSRNRALIGSEKYANAYFVALRSARRASRLTKVGSVNPASTCTTGVWREKGRQTQPSPDENNVRCEEEKRWSSNNSPDSSNERVEKAIYPCNRKLAASMGAHMRKLRVSHNRLRRYERAY